MDIVQLNLFDAELWLPVVGYEGLYEVSDHGNVRSLNKTFIQRSATGKIYKRPKKAKDLKLGLDRHGYYRISLNANGKIKNCGVHQLVLLAFVGSKPTEKHIVNHKDGNPKNNHVSNLEWVTYSENSQHAVDTGLSPKGEKCSWAKLTEETIRQVKLTWMSGVNQREISRRFSIDYRAIGQIIHESSWRHVHVDGYKEYRNQKIKRKANTST